MSNQGALGCLLNIEGLMVRFKELTVMDVRRSLENKFEDNADDQHQQIDNIIVDDDLVLADLLNMTDLSRKKAQYLAPHVLLFIGNTCKKVNHHFFWIATRLVNRRVALFKKTSWRQTPSTQAA